MRDRPSPGRLAATALPLVWFVVVAVLWTRPLVLHLADRVIAAPWWYDGLLNSAQLETLSSNLMRRPGRPLEGYQFYPHPDVLSFTEQMPALSLLARSFRALGATPIGAYNLVLLAGLALDGWLAYLLVVGVTARAPVALLAGTLVEGAPYLVYELGRVQLVWLAPLPLALLCVHRLAAGRRAGWAFAGLAFAVALAWGSCVYYAVLLTPLVALAALVYATSGVAERPAAFLARAAAAVAAGVAPVLPGLIVYRRVSATYGFGRSLDILEPARLSTYLHLEPGRWAAWSRGLAPGAAAAERVLFPGVVALGLAAFLLAAGLARLGRRLEARLPDEGSERRSLARSLWLAPLWLAALAALAWGHDASAPLAAALLTCLRPRRRAGADARAAAVRALAVVGVGSFALSLGASVTVGGAAYTLPLRWLFDLLPGWHAVRLVSRWGAFAAFGLASAGAVSLAAALERRRAALTAVPVALLGFALVELWPRPAPLVPIRPQVEAKAGFRFLRDHPGGALIAVPVRRAIERRGVDGFAEDAVLTYAAACFHHHPTVNGMSGFDPPFYREVVLPVMAAFPDAESLALLDVLGVRWVYVRGGLLEPAHFRALADLASAHPERCRVAVRERDELLLELVPRGPALAPPAPVARVATAPLPADCTVEARSGAAPASRLPAVMPQRGGEAVTVECARPFVAAGFAMGLGGRYAGYPRGLVIERREESGGWVPALVEPNAADLDRLVLDPAADRVVKTFPAARSRAWRIRQTGVSVRDPWSVAGLESVRPPG